jgi:hypothetical protein
MSEQAKSVYVPKSSAKARDTKIGQVINISFEAVELGKFVRANKNAKGWINLSVLPRKEVGKYGETHSIVLDTFEPKPKADAQPAQAADDASVPF